MQRVRATRQGNASGQHVRATRQGNASGDVENDDTAVRTGFFVFGTHRRTVLMWPSRDRQLQAGLLVLPSTLSLLTLPDLFDDEGGKHDTSTVCRAAAGWIKDSNRRFPNAFREA